MNFDSFLADILATIIGGAIVAFLFFLVREKLFALQDLDGSWTYEQETKSSEYKPYIGMTVTFLVLLARDGNKVYGSAEKIRDKTNNGEAREYIGQYRTRAEITGHIEKRYFSADRLSIHIVEAGEMRNSSTFHILDCGDSARLSGRFSSTVSNQTGIVTWIRRSS